MTIEFREFEDSTAVYDKYTLSNIGHIVKKGDAVVFEQLGYHGDLSIESMVKILSKMRSLQNASEATELLQGEIAK